jgi:hypothetical protein
VLDSARSPHAGTQSFLKVQPPATRFNPAPRVVRRGRSGIISRLIAETGWTKQSVETGLSQSLKDGAVLRIGDEFVDTPAMIEERLESLSELSTRRTPVTESQGSAAWSR